MFMNPNQKPEKRDPKTRNSYVQYANPIPQPVAAGER